ncbi:ATP-binding protein [Campylobacter suis]|uniref:Helicase HerA central domain-containing protein n=1 Tax=Campylobacter suis TaxID=2790657 RepID=A0ABM8Q0D2_9BACT|nr:DUF87 domain-containing protein [Campylobacter suis]CAD7286253.1 hypothetical protein LMG8286_00084 [Campylobacter suis]
MKSIQENLKLFYMGLKGGEPFFYKNKDLTTHAAIIGMTGSGKTGLGITLLEEACIDNIPSIIIDPKGDMTNLALAFADMSADDFLPYIDENEAANKGLSQQQMAQSESETWRNGIEATFQNLERVKTYKDSANFTIYTPKSSAGVGVALLSDFMCPNIKDDESFSNYINSLAASVLSLVGINDEDMNSKEQLLVATIFDTKFKEGRDVSIAELIGFIATPPFSKIGVFDVEQFYPSSERMKLAIKINTLVASPSFKGWSEGVRLEISKMLFDENGKAKCNIFTISHLNDTERMFFVTLLLNEIIAWMRTTEGTSSLRAILYMDEIFGFFPPNGNPPSKTPMLTLLKQARAFGIGCILSTQNPVDLDYKGLSNIGTWFIGRLQTAQDKARVIDGLTGISGSALDKSEIETTISNLAKRHFLVKNINDDGLSVISTRWALSYLKGPLSREQISNLMSEQKGEFSNKKVSKKIASSTVAPIISDEIEQVFASNKDSLAPNLFASVKVRYYDSKKGIDTTKELSYLYALEETQKDVDWMQASENFKFNTQDKPDNASYETLPSFIQSAKNLKSFEKDFKDFIFRNDRLELLSAMDINSLADESKEQFYVRLADRCNEILEQKSAELTQKFEKERAKLEEKLNKAAIKLQKEQQDMTASGLDAIISVGASLLGAFLGGSRGVTKTSVGKIATGVKSASRVLKNRTDVKHSEQSVEDINAQIEQLTQNFEIQAQELKDTYDVKNIKLESLILPPKKSDIYDEKVVLLWK